MSLSTSSSSKIHELVEFPVDLSQNVLPTNGDVLRGFYYICQQIQTTDCVPSVNETNAELVPAIMNLWVKASLSHTTDKRVAQMIKELLNKLKSIQSQPKNRLQSPAYLKKLEGFKQDLSTLFDITSCKCRFDLSAPMHNGKVTCIHPFDKQIPERELSFILDQRMQRRMVIGNVDTDVTTHNMQRAQKTSSGRTTASNDFNLL